MGISGWNESSQKSLWIYKKNDKVMDQIIRRNLIILGKLTVKKFPSLDNHSIWGSLRSTNNKTGQLTHEESFPSSSKKTLTIGLTFDSSKLH